MPPPSPPPYGQQPQGQQPGQQPPGQPHAQPTYQQPGYQYQQPYAGQYQQPYAGQYQQPGGYQQHGAYPQTGTYTTFPVEPGNDAAVGSLITSLSALGFLLFTAGLLAPLTLIASVAGIFIGKKGIKNVDEGRTRKHRDLAQAGFITGIIGVVVAVLATAGWVLLIVLGVSANEVSGGELDSLIP